MPFYCLLLHTLKAALMGKNRKLRRDPRSHVNPDKIYPVYSVAVTVTVNIDSRAVKGDAKYQLN